MLGRVSAALRTAFRRMAKRGRKRGIMGVGQGWSRMVARPAFQGKKKGRIYASFLGVLGLRA
jgi:hypothetical protein